MHDTGMEEIKERMSDIKSRASFFMSKRRSDRELYKLIADTMSICERVSALGLEEELRKDIRSRSTPETRSYVEKSSDVFLLVGRSVFEPELNRGTSWRYTSAMREANKRSINSREIFDWLLSNGGINTLFKGRGVLAKAVSTKTLNLNNKISVSKTSAITITIRMDHRGFFDVIDGPHEMRGV
jgi:hypothetical protein